MMTSLDQSRTPYADALRAKANRKDLDLMVPGHGQDGTGLSHDLAKLVGERALRVDIPLLVKGIDVGIDSPLTESLRLAADAWSVRKTLFLTNGASQANRMIMLALAASGLGDTVIAQRSAHSSLIDGLIVAEMLPRFILPSIDEARGINHGITPSGVETAISRAREDGTSIACVYVISPSYFGAVSDIEGIAEVAHRHGVPLVVDCAWGAHFGFHPELPESPTRLGADLVVSSTHKLGGSLSQSAMLHVCEGEFSAKLSTLLDRALMLTQSTSASALLLGSLDVARSSLAQQKELIGSSIKHVASFCEKLRADGRFEIISDSFSEFPDIIGNDPLRIPIDVSCTGRSGHDVKDALFTEFNIIVELATVSAIVAFIGPGKFPDLQQLLVALFTLADRARESYAQELLPMPPLPPPGELAVGPRSAYFGTHEIVTAEFAVGRISADTLSAYPPGIPNLLPGEIITQTNVKFLQAVSTSPIGYVRGALDENVDHFRVVKS